MSQPTTQPRTTQPRQTASPLKSVRWPLVVAALLVGHMLLMMVAVVWARTIPAAYTPIDSSTRGVEQDPLLPSESP